MLCENAEMDDASKCEVLAKEKFETIDEMQYWKARLMVNSKSEGSLEGTASFFKRMLHN